MTGVLVSGPAGAGKNRLAREMMDASAGPGVLVDFQSLYAAALAIPRLPTGRYPERLAGTQLHLAARGIHAAEHHPAGSRAGVGRLRHKFRR